MALPKLETPQHSCKLPLLGKEVFFRPFLVGEQKALLIAQESENQNEQVNEMMRLINLCSEDIVAEELTTVDLEYLFLQIRIKSVGETSDVVLACTHCEVDNEQTIKLEETEVFKEKEVSNIVSLTPEITMELTLPSYKMIQKIEVQTGEEGDIEDMKASDAFEVIQQCVVSIIDGDEVHSREDFTTTELIKFLDSMSVTMYSGMLDYFNSAPKLRIVQEYNCNACNKDNKIVLEGVGNFFD